MVCNTEEKHQVAYFDNLGRDLGIFVIVGGFVTVGRHGSHYELLIFPVVYVLIGLIVEAYRAIQRKNDNRNSPP